MDQPLPGSTGSGTRLVSTVGFAGLSHLGIVSALAAAERGTTVVAFDTDAALCARVDEGDFPIEEPGLGALHRRAAARVTVSDEAMDLGSCDVVYVSLDVDTNASGRSDLSRLEALVERVLSALTPGCTFVVLSQVAPGYTRQLLQRHEERLGDAEQSLYFQVETLVFGRAVENGPATRSASSSAALTRRNRCPSPCRSTSTASAARFCR